MIKVQVNISRNRNTKIQKIRLSQARSKGKLTQGGCKQAKIQIAEIQNTKNLSCVRPRGKGKLT